MTWAATPTPTSTVLICAYTEDRLEDIRAAVASVQAQRPAPDQLVVVVDHNPALFARLQDELGDVTVMENRHRQGLAGARNTGVEEATGEVVVFLDDDAAAEPDWLAALLSTYDDPEVLGAGGVIDPVWPATRPRWLPHEFDWVVGCTYRGGATGRAPIRNLIGASMSLRRSAFDLAGGFTEGMGRIGRRPLGCEETELCLRVNRHFPSGTFLFEPAAAVRHRVSPDRTRPRYFLSRCYAEGLSKATVAHLAGADRGLAAERAHAARALPLGFARGLRDAVRGDIGGLFRAIFIIVGLAVTTAGYARGRLARTTLTAAPLHPSQPNQKGVTSDAEVA